MSGADGTGLIEPPPAPVPAPEPAAEPPKAASATVGAHDSTIVNGVLWQATLRWLSQVLSWSATIVIARRLSPEDYGIAGSATVLVGLMTIATEGGIGRALVMRRERETPVQQQAHGASIILGITLAVVMLLSAYPLSLFYGEPRVAPLVAALSLVMLLSGSNAIPLALLQQQLEYRRLAAIDFTKAIAQASVVMIGALLGFGAWALVAGLIAGHASVALLVRRWVQLAPVMAYGAALRANVHYARHLIVASLAWYIFSSADFAVVGRVAGLAALGYYQFAWNVAQLPGEKLANVLQSVVGPFFGAIGDDKEQLKHYFLLLSEFLVMVMFPILAGFALVAPVAIPLIFGDKWLQAVPVVQVLVVASGISSVSMLSQHVLVATGNARASTRIAVGAALTMPFLFYFAARTAGPLAVASCWLVAQPVLAAVPLIYVRRAIHLPVRRYLANLWAPVIGTSVMIMAVLGVQFAIADQARLLQLVIMSVIGAVVYVGMYAVFFRRRVDAIRALWKNRG